MEPPSAQSCSSCLETMKKLLQAPCIRLQACLVRIKNFILYLFEKIQNLFCQSFRAFYQKIFQKETELPPKHIKEILNAAFLLGGISIPDLQIKSSERFFALLAEKKINCFFSGNAALINSLIPACTRQSALFIEQIKLGYAFSEKIDNAVIKAAKSSALRTRLTSSGDLLSLLEDKKMSGLQLKEGYELKNFSEIVDRRFFFLNDLFMKYQTN